MATYAIAAGDRAAHDKTLVASTVDTVTFPGDVSAVTIVTDGVAKIYYTLDGSTPTVGGGKTFALPAAAGAEERLSPGSQDTVVKLISAGTPTYSVVGS